MAMHNYYSSLKTLLVSATTSKCIDQKEELISMVAQVYRMSFCFFFFPSLLYVSLLVVLSCLLFGYE